MIVEDVIDSGLTLNYLSKNLKARNPASLEICSLLAKPDANHSVEIKYTGFSIPSDFVVGYGLDFAENYRNLRDIAVLKKSPVKTT